MVHHFSESLKIEREHADYADKFYTHVLGATHIIRYNSGSIADMAMQKDDIDVTIEVGKRTFHISEKFRTHDYGDLYFEIYSKYPNVKGWMDTGKPQILLYFTPKQVLWIAHESLKEFYIIHLKPVIRDEWFSNLISLEQFKHTYLVYIGVLKAKLQIIRATNFENKAWETMGVSVEMDVLKKFGVKIRKFSKTNFSV